MSHNSRQSVEVRQNSRHLAASVLALTILIVYSISILASAEREKILWHSTCLIEKRTIYRGGRHEIETLIPQLPTPLREAPASFPQPRQSGAGMLRGQADTVPGVLVKLTGSLSAPDPRSATTDADGHYRFTKLLPGTYAIEVRLEGFQPLAESVAVAPGDAKTQNISMELDKVTQKIEVRDKAAAVSTEVTDSMATIIPSGFSRQGRPHRRPLRVNASIVFWRARHQEQTQLLGSVYL